MRKTRTIILLLTFMAITAVQAAAVRQLRGVRISLQSAPEIYSRIERGGYNAVFVDVEPGRPLLWNTAISNARSCDLEIYAVIDGSRADETLFDSFTELVADHPFDGILIETDKEDKEADLFALQMAWLIEDFRPWTRLGVAVDGDDEDYSRWIDLLDGKYIDFIVPRLDRRGNHGIIPTVERWSSTEISPLVVLDMPETDRLSPSRFVDLVSESFPPLGGIIFTGVGEFPDSLFLHKAHMPVFGSSPEPLPSSPSNVSLDQDDSGNYLLTWEAPDQGPDEAPVKYYTVYLAQDGAVDLFDPLGEAVHRTASMQFTYPGTVPGLEFAVTAFDILGRESRPTFSGKPLQKDMSGRGHIFRYCADNLYISDPEEIDRVDIYTMWGNHVKSVKVRSSEVSIDCGDLEGGVYVVRTRYDNGSTRVEKFIR